MLSHYLFSFLQGADTLLQFAVLLIFAQAVLSAINGSAVCLIVLNSLLL